MKTKEEMTAIKEDVETLNSKLAELSENELKEVTGGFIPPYPLSGLTLKTGCKDTNGNDPNGWEDPKYILGVGSKVSGMQTSPEAKPVD